MVEINFPLFPRRVYGVLNAIFLIILGFWFYYLGIGGDSGYKQIEEKYLDGVTPVQANIVGDEAQNCIKVTLQIPKKVTHVIDRPIYITLTNTGDIDFQDLQIWLGPESFENAVSMTEGRVYFKTLARHSIVTGKISLRAKPNVGYEEEFLIKPKFYSSTQDTLPAQLKLDRTPPPVSYDSKLALWNSLGEIILMPPWSNGVLVLFILILSGITEMVVHLTQKEARVGAYKFLKNPKQNTQLLLETAGNYWQTIIKRGVAETNDRASELGAPQIGGGDTSTEAGAVVSGETENLAENQSVGAEGKADVVDVKQNERTHKGKKKDQPIWFSWVWGLSTWLAHLGLTYFISRIIFDFLISRI